MNTPVLFPNQRHCIASSHTIGSLLSPLTESLSKLRRRNAAILVASAAAFGALPAIGADVLSTWSTATSGDWNLNANWINTPSLGGFPNNGNGGVATYDALIDVTGA